MQAANFLMKASAIAVISMLAGCATWNSMDRQEKGTATGAAGGALVGAAVGGPVGAVVGAGVGGYAGHYETEPGGIAAAPASNANGRAGGMVSEQSSPTVRAAQQALNDRGFNAGTADGVYGPNTESALRDFQRAQGLQQTGTLDQATLSALGVSGSAAAAPGPANPNGNMSNRSSGTSRSGY